MPPEMDVTTSAEALSFTAAFAKSHDAVSFLFSFDFGYFKFYCSAVGVRRGLSPKQHIITSLASSMDSI